MGFLSSVETEAAQSSLGAAGTTGRVPWARSPRMHQSGHLPTREWSMSISQHRSWVDGLPLLSGCRETRQGRQNRTHTTCTQRKSYGFRSTQTGGERGCCGLAKVRKYISMFPSLALLLKNTVSCKSKTSSPSGAEHFEWLGRTNLTRWSQQMQEKHWAKYHFRSGWKATRQWVLKEHPSL